EDRADREDRALPVAGDPARRPRQQPRERVLLASDLAVLLVADRRQLEGARRRLQGQERQAVEPAGGPEPRPLRRRGRAPEGERQSEGQERSHRRAEEGEGGDARRRARLDEVAPGSAVERRADSDPRRPVGEYG